MHNKLSFVDDFFMPVQDVIPSCEQMCLLNQQPICDADHFKYVVITVVDWLNCFPDDMLSFYLGTGRPPL